MPPAVGGLVVICLRRRDIAEPGSTAHDIHQDCGDFGASNVGKSLLHETYSGTGRRGHDAHASTGGAIDHVDRAQFTFGLDKRAPKFRHPPGEILERLCLRCDRIAEIGLQTGANGGFRYRLITFPHFTCHRFSVYLVRA